jgi:hypothetical protein
MSLTVSEMVRELSEIRATLSTLWSDEDAKYLREAANTWPPPKEPVIKKRLESARRAVAEAETRVRKLV